MKTKENKTPYQTLSSKPIKAPSAKKTAEPKASKITAAGDLRARKVN